MTKGFSEKSEDSGLGIRQSIFYSLLFLLLCCDTIAPLPPTESLGEARRFPSLPGNPNQESHLSGRSYGLEDLARRSEDRMDDHDLGNRKSGVPVCDR